MNDRIFSTRALGWLVAVGLLSFIGAFVVSLYSDKIGYVRSHGANSYSESAIGHKAFVSLLRELDYRVRISRQKSGSYALNDLYMMIEPGISPDLGNLNARLSEGRSLLVLPKWQGYPDPFHNGWLRGAALRQREEAEELLQLVVPDGQVMRQAPDRVATGADLTATEIDVANDLEIQSLQLIRSEVIEPIIYNDQGVLLGRVTRVGHRLPHSYTWVLSDPDILANHGLNKLGNAQTALNVVEHLLPFGGAVVIDETGHGFAHEPSLWRRLLEFPFAVVTILGVIAVLVLCWAAMIRFGPPRRTAKSYQAGKGFLIRNTADLLAFGGHGALMLQDYKERTLQAVALGLHAPEGLDRSRLLRWLDRVAQARNVSLDTEKVIHRAEAVAAAKHFDIAQAISAARAIHLWKREMLHGTGSNPGH